MDNKLLHHYLSDSPPTIVPLSIKPHFGALDHKSQLYAHYLSQASFAGTRITLRQTSPESETIYDLIIALHKHCDGDWEKWRRESGVSEEDKEHFLQYAAQFLGNGGNYKSFGDTKFIPRLPQKQFKALASCSEVTAALYEKAQDGIYAGKDVAKMHLGYPDQGHVSTYYPDSPEITREEISIVSEFLDEKGLLPENTRLRKFKSRDFEVLIASAEMEPGQRDLKDGTFELEGKLKGKKVKLVFGDYTKEMEKIANFMKKAHEYAANDTQRSMTAAYETSFRTGSLEAFKDSQRYWIKDKGPLVETNIGFIETYRDPHGIRGEWEGFVAMVNQERTRAFQKLVEAAPGLIPLLPWDKEFEKDTFLSPDFTSLEVLTFAGSGIPAGINIPNYNDIRQTLGFKNVSLGNVLGAKAPNEPIPFISPTDLPLYQKYRDAAFEVQVGLHELLGHGCGKLLQETSPGEYNFDDKEPPVSPLTGNKITSWYRPGQTWGSVFGSLAGAYEECRAECVAMVLCCDFKVLEIFGFGKGEAEGKGDEAGNLHGEAGDVLYAAYLSMARAGVVALEFYDPKSRKWGQPHMQARYSILRTFLSAGEEFASLEYNKNIGDLSALTIKINRSKILTHGRPAVEKYLQKLHIYKSTADIEAGRKMFEDITSVDEWWGGELRDEVLRRKTARKVFVQGNTVLEEGGDDGEGKVMLREYEASCEGMVRSWVERGYV